MLLVVSQCSPYAGSRILSFFFDGVPGSDTSHIVSPDTISVQKDSVRITEDADLEKVAVMVVHYPYAERECESCHDPGSLGSMIESEPGLCNLCHEDLGILYNYLHGPVAGGYCTACHNPHQSKYESLLRYSGEELCFYCHIEADVSQNEIHQDLGNMVCMDCHNPHGGEDKFILY